MNQNRENSELKNTTEEEILEKIHFPHFPEEEENEEESSENSLASAKVVFPLPISAYKKRGAFFLGVFMILVAIIGTIALGLPHKTEKEIALASYKLTADSTYRVHLIKNTLFPKEWLGENLVYAEKLTDYIEINFISDIVSDNPFKLSGEYTITAIIEGYESNGDEKRQIYERQYPLAKEKVKPAQNNHLKLEKTLTIKPEAYQKYIEEAETILGGSTSKEMKVLFAGKFTIDGQDKPFNYTFPVPIDKTAFYELKKPEPTTDQGKLTEIKQAWSMAPLSTYLPLICLFLLGIGLILFSQKYSRVFTPDEAYQADLKQIIRKYGSRMVCLKAIPSTEGKEILIMNEMESMLALAEELREPILYCTDEDDLPKNGCFYIFAKTYVYTFQVDKSLLL